MALSVKEKIDQAKAMVNVPLIVNVILAGVAVTGTIYALRKVGFNKAANVVKSVAK